MAGAYKGTRPTVPLLALYPQGVRGLARRNTSCLLQRSIFDRIPGSAGLRSSTIDTEARSSYFAQIRKRGRHLTSPDGMPARSTVDRCAFVLECPLVEFFFTFFSSWIRKVEALKLHTCRELTLQVADYLAQQSKRGRTGSFRQLSCKAGHGL